MMGSWLKQFSSMSDVDMFKMMSNPWQFWNSANSSTTQSDKGTNGSPNGHKENI
jgi:hypothetical protein